ncbi:MAG: hypothetical protein GPJ54_06415 [Candidatus Heimdallarchaeota archaeon]|nr:hypothetical protein [Candidatus Heimdallarchaeota archaeon]
MPNKEKDQKLNTEFDEESLIKKYKEIQTQGIGMAILIALEMYGSLNFEGIHDMLGDVKKKTSIFNQVKKLHKEDFIEIDPIATRDSRGIYYQLGKLSREMLNYAKSDKYRSQVRTKTNELIQMDEDDLLRYIINELKGKNFDELALQVKMLSNINTFIENMAIKNVRKIWAVINENKDLSEVELLAKIKEQEKPLTFMNISSESVPLATRSQYSRFMDLYFNFTQDLNNLIIEFENENKDLSESEIVNQYLYMFSAPIHRDITKNITNS